MSKQSHSLKDLLPREQSGARTGELYEYQYHQAAHECLTLLDDKVASCVFCEWHDDYVSEVPTPTRYRFYQVKTRKAALGPWTISAFFGLKKKPGPKSKKSIQAPKLDKDSIAARMMEHYINFASTCEILAFVTDNAIHPDFSTFNASIQKSKAHTDLDGTNKTTFDDILSAFSTANKAITPNFLFDFLKLLRVFELTGSSVNLKINFLLMADKIKELSEVDLTTSQASNIGKSLVEKVRERSHRVLPVPPTTDTELRSAKGIVIEDVLSILSLSASGYRALKAEGIQAVRALSRLQRLCKRSQVPESMITDICRFKSAWDAWKLAERHQLDELDLLALKADCALVLGQHSQGQLSFQKLGTEAKSLASKYKTILNSTSQLTDELVMGFIFALAAESSE